MIDLALDPVSRDLVFAGRNVVLVEGPEKVAQAVGIRLRCWLGEWFLDTTHGVPYLESVLGKARRPEMVEAILRAQILDVDGVQAITSFVLSLDNATRTARVDFEIATAAGTAAGTASLAR